MVGGWADASSEESFALKLRVAPTNRLSFIVFNQDEFLPNFEGPALQSYTQYLQQKYPGRVTVLNEKAEFNLEQQIPFIDYCLRNSVQY